MSKEEEEEEDLVLLSVGDQEMKDRVPSLKQRLLAHDFQKPFEPATWLNWWQSQGKSDQERYETVLENCLQDNQYHMRVICVVGQRLVDLFLLASSSMVTSFPAFESLSPPEISIPDYFYKLIRGSGSDLSTAVLSAFLIQKFKSLHPFYAINCFRIHKIVLGAVIASHKYLEEDHPKSNRAFACLSHLPLKMVSQIEAEFLFAVGFDIEETPFFGVLGSLFQNDFKLVVNQKEKRKSDYLEGLGFKDCFL